MNFNQALEAMKHGERVSRASFPTSFYRLPMSIWLKPEFIIKPEMCHDPILREICDQRGGEVIGLPQFSMFDGFRIQGGYNLSAADILADDWYIVNSK